MAYFLCILLRHIKKSRILLRKLRMRAFTKRKTTTEERTKLVRRLRKQGLTIKEIVAQTGWNINTVKRYIQLAQEPRGKRKKYTLVKSMDLIIDKKCRHFTSEKLLCTTLAGQYKIDENRLRDNIVVITFENIETIIDHIPFLIGNSCLIVKFDDNVHERSDSSQKYKSINAAFICGLLLNRKIAFDDITVDDFFTLTSSRTNDEGKREKVLTYFYVLIRKKREKLSFILKN